MGQINVRKRGNVYEYFFEGAKVNNKRTRISKSGFKTNYFEFIGNDPVGSLQIPRILTFESKKTMPSMYIQ